LTIFPHFARSEDHDLPEQLHLLSPKGFRAGAASAGIKSKPGALDVGLLVCDAPDGATAAAVFTTNKVVSPGVTVGREHLQLMSGRLHGVVVNSGNANACTGKQGERDARRMCAVAASEVNCHAKMVLPSSTGIIGHLLPMSKLEPGIRAAAADLGSTRAHAMRFADAILTTDLVRKTAAARVKLSTGTVTIAGVCKGSGMIGPRLALHPPPHATMLAYLTTDAEISVGQLRRTLGPAADRSFNAVTVDDHSSTNDTAAVLASGMSGVKVASRADVERFARALTEVCQSLAYQIASDGEGATKVVRIDVTGAKTTADAATIARSIANSPLVKCAMHGNDPNWGRIVSAAGMCGVPFDANRTTLTLQGTRVFHRGGPVKFDAAKVSRALRAKEVVAVLNCNLGDGDATVWTCDLSREYIRINADYHT
jgi:glutamate N-acetyltransferase/amino-acid N-acetyltransferase